MFEPTTKLRESLRRLRPFLLTMACVYLFSGALGSILVSLEIAPLVHFRVRILEFLPTATPIVDVLGELQAGRVAQAIGMTFAWNFGVAAFLTSTAVGVVFFLPPMIAAWRGFLLGVLFQGLGGSFATATLLLGTLLLEIGAYVIAGAAGMSLGWALIPRGAGEGIKDRARRALSDILTVYPLVAGMLLFGAVWEILGVYLLSPPAG